MGTAQDTALALVLLCSAQYRVSVVLFIDSVVGAAVAAALWYGSRCSRCSRCICGASSMESMATVKIVK